MRKLSRRNFFALSFVFFFVTLGLFAEAPFVFDTPSDWDQDSRVAFALDFILADSVDAKLGKSKLDQLTLEGNPGSMYIDGNDPDDKWSTLSKPVQKTVEDALAAYYNTWLTSQKRTAQVGDVVRRDFYSTGGTYVEVTGTFFKDVEDDLQTSNQKQTQYRGQERQKSGDQTIYRAYMPISSVNGSQASGKIRLVELSKAESLELRILE